MRSPFLAEIMFDGTKDFETAHLHTHTHTRPCVYIHNIEERKIGREKRRQRENEYICQNSASFQVNSFENSLKI